MQTSTATCANCDVVIVGEPVRLLRRTFCCAGCAADGPCTCSYDPPVEPILRAETLHEGNGPFAAATAERPGNTIPVGAFVGTHEA